MLALMLFSSVASAVIVAGVFFLDRALQMRGLPSRWLWLFAMVACCAVTVSPFAVRTAPAPIVQRDPVTASSSAPSAAAAAAAVPSLPSVRPPQEDADPSQAPARRSHFLDLSLLVMWALASATCFLTLAVAAWRIARMRRSWREAVISGVPVLVSHDVGPAIVGLIHHGVVVPAWVEELRAEEQKLVLRHEREHVRAGDPLLLWISTGLCAVLPWNPAMWVALRMLKHSIEIDCDARVLSTQTDAHAYCTLLLDVGERTLAGVAPMAALAEPSTLLERRVYAMTSGVAAGWRASAIAACGVALLAAACVAPMTKLSPNSRALALASELSGILAKDSTALPASVREDLAAKLARRGVTSGVVKRTSDEWERLLEPQIDSVLHRFYPRLYARKDTIRRVAVMDYDAQGTLEAHTVMTYLEFRTYPMTRGDDEVLGLYDRFSDQGPFQLIAHRERPDIRLSILFRVERAGAPRVGSESPKAAMPTTDAAKRTSASTLSALDSALSKLRSTGSSGGDAITDVIGSMLHHTGDSLARVAYPGLLSGGGGDSVLVMAFDAGGKLRAHSVEAPRRPDGFGPEDWSTLQIGLFHIERKTAKRMFLYMIAHDPNADASRMIKGVNRIAPPDLPPTGIADSMAQANDHLLTRSLDSATVVLVVVGPDKKFLRGKIRTLPFDQVYNAIPGQQEPNPLPRDVSYLMRLVEGGPSLPLTSTVTKFPKDRKNVLVITAMLK